MKQKRYFGAIESGGTKFICAIASEDGSILSKKSFPTTEPEQTLNATKEFFKLAENEYGQISSLGIASFGPVDINTESETYGYITSTPKENWSNTDVVGFYKQAFNVPVGFNTDVNAAALAERSSGAAQSLENFIYVTVGTGLGAGIVSGGSLVQGVTHPEVGHILIPKPESAADFEGACPFHGACLEGLAAGPSIKARWGEAGQDMGPDHPAWDEQAYYLAVMCVNFCAFFAPQRIIIGGGVMSQSHLFPMIRKKFSELANGYFSYHEVSNLDSFIVPSPLDGQAGLHGAILLAKEELAG